MIENYLMIILKIISFFFRIEIKRNIHYRNFQHSKFWNRCPPGPKVLRPGVGAKKNFGYRWVPGTGQKKKFWVPMGTRFRPEKKFWVPMGTGYWPEKKFWVSMGTGNRPEEKFWVTMGTGKIFTYADPWLRH